MFGVILWSGICVVATIIAIVVVKHHDKGLPRYHRFGWGWIIPIFALLLFTAIAILGSDATQGQSGYRDGRYCTWDRARNFFIVKHTNLRCGEIEKTNP